MVKKGPLKIIHEQSKHFLDECHRAFAYKKGFKGSIIVPPELDPKTVHSLFKNMIDEVLLITYCYLLISSCSICCSFLFNA